jgi:hypothetical protein
VSVGRDDGAGVLYGLPIGAPVVVRSKAADLLLPKAWADLGVAPVPPAKQKALDAAAAAARS